VLHKKGKECISTDIYKYLDEFDLRVGTLECAVGEDFEFDPEKMNVKEWQYVVHIISEDLDKLVALDIDVVSLANNHVFDLGEKGFINTLNEMKKRNIKYFGAGINSEYAARLAIFNIRQKNIALLGYLPPERRAPHPASENKPGINLLHIDKVCQDVHEAKKHNDYVFIIPHWGMEYTYFPPIEKWEYAKRIIDAGADGVMGSHAHHVQPVINYIAKPIYFNLGNFLFPDWYIAPPRSTWYPSQEEPIDIAKIRKCYNYPFVSEITLNIWQKKARTGMIANISLDEKIAGSYKMTYLTKQNNIILKSNAINYILMINVLKVLIQILGRHFWNGVKIYKYLKGKVKGRDHSTVVPSPRSPRPSS
jgi:hypothetical protein